MGVMENTYRLMSTVLDNQKKKSEILIQLTWMNKVVFSYYLNF